MAEPVRTCVGCGAKASPRALVRLVAGDAGVGLGEPGRGGRGAWIHAEEACIQRAVRRRAFARALRSADAVPDGAVLRLLLTGSARKN
jgi:predicted RNA-binding protein YlxR (DUF448 family)